MATTGPATSRLDSVPTTSADVSGEDPALTSVPNAASTAIEGLSLAPVTSRPFLPSAGTTLPQDDVSTVVAANETSAYDDVSTVVADATGAYDDVSAVVAANETTVRGTGATATGQSESSLIVHTSPGLDALTVGPTSGPGATGGSTTIGVSLPTGPARVTGPVTRLLPSAATASEMTPEADMTSYTDGNISSAPGDVTTSEPRTLLPIVMTTVPRVGTTTDIHDVSTPPMMTTTPKQTTSTKPPPAVTTSMPWSDNTTQGDAGGGLTQGAIIGIAVGVSVFVLLVIGVVVFILRKRCKSKRSHSSGDDNVNDYKLEIRDVFPTTASTSDHPKGFKTFFSQVDEHDDDEQPALSPTGVSNPTYGGARESNGISTAAVHDYADIDVDEDGNDQRSINRPRKDSNYNNRALLAQSRMSVGPVLLDGEDYSTGQAYDKMFSTNTFK